MTNNLYTLTDNHMTRQMFKHIMQNNNNNKLVWLKQKNACNIASISSLNKKV